MTITDLAVRMTALERRLAEVEANVAALERHLPELEALKKMVGDLKFEIEDMQEA
jgi:uncharacterized coiled-coil protein SlyX